MGCMLAENNCTACEDGYKISVNGADGMRSCMSVGGMDFLSSFSQRVVKHIFRFLGL